MIGKYATQGRTEVVRDRHVATPSSWWSPVRRRSGQPAASGRISWWCTLPRFDDAADASLPQPVGDGALNAAGVQPCRGRLVGFAAGFAQRTLLLGARTGVLRQGDAETPRSRVDPSRRSSAIVLQLSGPGAARLLDKSCVKCKPVIPRGGELGANGSDPGAKRGLYMRRSLIPVIVVIISFFFLAATARGDVRTLTVPDPVDAPPAISGVPSNPDITQLDVTYDTSGSITITVAFANSLNSLDLSQDYAEFGSFIVSTGTPWGNVDPLCDNGAPGMLAGQNHIASNVETFSNQATIGGYTGTLPFTMTKSPDGNQITLQASSPALANQNYTCASYTAYARVLSNAANLNSNYDEYCDCWYVTSELDAVPDDAPASGAWFNGFAPALPAPPAPPAPTPPAPPQPTPPANNHPKKKADAAKPLPLLTTWKAKRYGHAALRRHLNHVEHLTQRCGRRSRTRMICRVTLTAQRNVKWRGAVTVWYSRSKSGNVWWNYSLKLIGRRSSCTTRRCVEHLTVR